MSRDDRRGLILDRLRQEGTIDVGDLAQALDVSAMTVRRDLTYLDNAGLLRRVHGGAITRPSPTTRSATMPAEKLRIAKRVRSLVTGGETVGIDAGTTCTAVAAQLAQMDSILGVTNSLQAALEFQNSRSSMIVLGGLLTPEFSLVNGAMLEMRGNVHLDKLILGCGGVSSVHGLSYFDLAETEVRKELVRRSDAVILAVDHTKLERRRAIILDRIDILDVMVTSAEPPEPLREALERASVEIVVASQ